jgi:hypothetical protein
MKITLRIISLLPIIMLLVALAFSQSIKVPVEPEVSPPKIGPSPAVGLQEHASLTMTIENPINPNLKSPSDNTKK